MTFYQLCSSIILNDGMIVNDELGIWNEAACFKGLSQHFSRETQESHSKH
jgi:hypothetical protein